MPKTKINVLTVTVKVDIPVDPGSIQSVQMTARQAESLREAAARVGLATMKTRLNRVPAPQPQPAAETIEAE
jgi:ABC-type thiamine transport system ATPase subunit